MRGIIESNPAWRTAVVWNNTEREWNGLPVGHHIAEASYFSFFQFIRILLNAAFGWSTDWVLAQPDEARHLID